DSASEDHITEEMGVNKKVYIGVPGLEEANHELKHSFPQGHKVVKTTLSGGSLTALPIVETLEGEVSAYIPTNVISTKPPRCSTTAATAWSCCSSSPSTSRCRPSTRS